MSLKEEKTKIWITITMLGLSIIIWSYGLIRSPILHPDMLAEKRSTNLYLRNAAPDIAAQLVLAEAYWMRYPDIREDPFFGEHGPNGIRGARVHFEQHGKREGRIFGPLPEIDNTEEEKILAKAYWRRYPDIGESKVWGRKSELSFLGPRDHYRYVGKDQNRIWGIEEK